MTDTVTIVVQARMGSTRLPGKVLAEVGGTPSLAFMVGRLRTLTGVTVVVATSDTALDDPVEDVARAAGIAVVRGAELDVLERFGEASAAHPSDHVVRLTADCPLVDPGLVDAVVARHLATGADYTSNSLIRTFPDGLDVEVLRTSVLRDAVDHASEGLEREHVTPYVYRRDSTFRLEALVAEERWGHLRWTVDEPEDLERIRDMVRDCDGTPPLAWEAILAGLDPAERAPVQDGLVPARPGSPALGARRPNDPTRRAWDVLLDGQARGWLAVDVHDSVGTLQGSVPTEHISWATAQLEQALRADFQVAQLTGQLEDPTGDP